MSIPYSNDLRGRVINLINRGKKQVEIARLFSIDRSTIYRWTKSYKDTGSYSSRGYNNNQDKIKIKDTSKISNLLKSNPFMTAVEISTELKEDITSASISNYIKRLGLTLKKTPKHIKKEMKNSGKSIKN